jgi:hypothetical protein
MAPVFRPAPYFLLVLVLIQATAVARKTITSFDAGGRPVAWRHPRKVMKERASPVDVPERTVSNSQAKTENP